MSDDTTRTDEDADDELAPGAPDAQSGKRVSRRGLFRAGAATGLTAAGAYAAVLPGVRSDADAAPAPAAVIPIAQVQQIGDVPAGANTLAGYTFFNPLMVDVITAAAERIIPRDDNGPGATDAGVVYFIDRQLSSEYGMVGKRYGAGPFTAGNSNQGDQSGLSMRDRYRIGIDGMQAYAQATFQKDFKDLGPDQQDQILRDMEGGKATGFPGSGGQTFFTLLVNHVKAGFFADPIYGGNRDMVGWKMIGYPGAQIVYQNWISRYGEKFTEPFMSLADHQEALHQPAGGAPMSMSPAPSTGGAAATAAAVSPGSPIATGSAGTAAPAMGAAMAGGTTVNVVTKDYSFTFDKTDIPAGMVTFNISNQGMRPHNLSFTSLNMTSMTIRNGEMTQFTVSLPQGMVPYICAIPGHADLGMKGNLNIVPAMSAAGMPAPAVSAPPAPATMPAPAASATPAPAASATPAPAAMTGGMTVNVIEKDFSFAFDTSMIRAGMVTFNIVNQGKAPHNLEFTTINKVSETSNAGEMTKFTVNLPPGDYPYICNIPGHAQLGMKGTLTVK